MKMLTTFVLFFCLILLISCSDLPIKKGKKGDFTFRKCTSCKITD